MRIAKIKYQVTKGFMQVGISTMAKQAVGTTIPKLRQAPSIEKYQIHKTL